MKNARALFIRTMKQLTDSRFTKNPDFIAYYNDQFDLLSSGIRDGRISDNAIIAWEAAGQKLY